MKKENIFYLIFILTILAIRTGVFLFPHKKLIIGGMIIHHFWIGAILILFVLFLLKRYDILRIIIFSIGSGLAADELIYIILGGRTVSEYWSIYSIFGTIMMAVIIFPIRKRLTVKI